MKWRRQTETEAEKFREAGSEQEMEDILMWKIIHGSAERSFVEKDKCCISDGGN